MLGAANAVDLRTEAVAVADANDAADGKATADEATARTPLVLNLEGTDVCESNTDMIASATETSEGQTEPQQPAAAEVSVHKGFSYTVTSESSLENPSQAAPSAPECSDDDLV